MAEALTKKLGRDDLEAFSAGSKPSGIVNPKAIDSMKEINYDLSSHESKDISLFKNDKFDVVVTMGCGDKCPWIDADKYIEWDIPDPKYFNKKKIRIIRQKIGDHIEKLING